MALFAPLAMMGQTTLTVCDGTITNSYIPVYGLYVDTQGCTSEFIIPATTEGMSDMTCGAINQLTFYISGTPATWGSPTIQVYIGEVEGTTLSGVNGPTNFTTVYTGTLSNQTNPMVIEFSEAYTYNGGNLLIGTYVKTASSTYKGTSFYGVSAPSGSSRYRSSGTGSGTAQSFLPKTTFTYTPNPYVAPASISYTNNEPGNTTVSWTAPVTTETVTGYGYRYKLTSETEWPEFNTADAATTSVTIASLAFGAEYEFEVKAIYGDNESCVTKNVTFTTLEACMTPENLTISDVTAHTATLNWTEGYGDGEWVLQYKLSTEEEYTKSVNVALADLPYTLSGLTAESTYNVMIAPVCDATKTIAGNFTTTVACFAPTNLAVSANVQTATFTWESDVNDYEIAHATEATADPNDNIVGTATENTYSMSDLTLADHYFWVRSNCGSEGYSSWAGPVSVHIGYCVPAPSSVDNNGISNVTFGSGDYVVNNDTPKATYTDYSSLVGAVQAGVESTIAITFKTGYTYNTYVWVDLDNSLSFEASEVICYGESTSTNPTTLTLNFTIPANQTLGDFRLRIGSADSGLGSDPTAANPCYTSTYGCFQDYTLRVLEAPACLTPSNLVFNASGHTLQASWDGTATSYNIDINGIVTNNVENPYVFEVELSTTYTVKVQANCTGETSDWSNEASFTTPDCWGGHLIEYTLTDSYNDSWNGASISVVEGCGDIVATLTCASGASPFAGTLTLCSDYYRFIWNKGSYDSECGFTFTEGGTTLFTKPSSLSDGQVLYTIGTTTPVPTALTAGTPDKTSVELSWTAGGTETAWQICVNGDEDNLIKVTENPYILNQLTPDTDYSVKVRAFIDETTQSCWSAEETFTTAIACARPENLAQSNITTKSATLSWEGESDSYMLEYRPWVQVGEDKQSTAVLTTYNYDLSAFAGTGSIAIRHYDVTDMFMINVDDIVVKNAANEVIYSEDFEAGSIPSNITNMDLDGDGYEWGIRTNADDDYGNPSGNGTYCVSSASWVSSVGALTPDNWMIISGIEFGGSLSFVARGQDPTYPSENFAVYISLESNLVEVPVTGTTYTATGLMPNTPYAWQVKGICGDDESRYVSSFFKTADNLLIFANDGEWNDLNNWTDLYGEAITALPTTADNVRIDAEANIAEAEIGYANKVTLGNAGAITIQDGGQLKHSSSTLRVTMYKSIEGYVDPAGQGQGADKWSFISSPFTGITQIVTTPGAWSHVLNLENGKYDLYGFNVTNVNANGPAEWVNWKTDDASSNDVFHAGENVGLRYTYGYLYANKEDVELEFTGTTVSSNNNSETSPLTYYDNTAYAYDGFKLVGNPFVCNGYLTFVPASATEPVAIDYYVMNDEGNGFVIGQTNDGLAPLQGAFVYANQSGDINFSSEMPATSKRGSSVININLMQNGKVADMARIRFGEGMQLAKKSFREDASSIYFPQENDDYAVAYAQASGEMPLNFKAETTGYYTINFKVDGANLGYLHLIDKLAGEDIDLLTNPEYRFIASPSDREDRFVVSFGQSMAGDNFVYQSGDELIVTGEGTLQMFDVMGRFVGSYVINGVQTISKPAEGVYVFRMVGETMKTQKIIVR